MQLIDDTEDAIVFHTKDSNLYILFQNEYNCTITSVYVLQGFFSYFFRIYRYRVMSRSLNSAIHNYYVTSG